VQAGDSLWTISQQFGITIDALAKANNLNPPYSLIPGQTLHIPTTSTSNRPLSAPSLTSSTTYTIQPGDTLSAIAQHFNIALALLAQANGLSNPNDIVAGQVLQIPQTTPATVSVNSGSPSTSSA
jgi:LysM repeat protein